VKGFAIERFEIVTVPSQADADVPGKARKSVTLAYRRIYPLEQNLDSSVPGVLSRKIGP